ncbi:hypothetical protein [Microtetraspora niveoalba]|uniref:hypothetical protein n=1 Tax=Microtetraspora niveoalba TaxID=46175 RepID=UPI000833A846|nr:hypothetical protein [Microtetraspora niveoalba]
MTDPDLAAALTDLRVVVVTGLTEIRGQYAVVIQRLEYVDTRHAELVRRMETELAEHEARLDELGKGQQKFVTKDEHAERNRRLLAIIGLMLTAASLVITFFKP